MSELTPPAAAPARPPARLAAVFRALDESGVRWSLLRPPQSLAEPAGDVDLLVDPAALARVRELLIAQGFVAVPLGGRDLHAADFDAASGRLLWLHVQPELRVAGATLPAAAVLDGAVRDPLPRPDDAWLLWIVLLHGLVDKGRIAARHRPSLARLASTPGAAQSPLATLAARRGLAPSAVLRLVAAEKWERLAALPVVPPPAAARVPRAARVAAALRSARGLWERRGIGVAVIGPDGAGKTTLVDGLRASLPLPTRTLYMGLTGGRMPKADRLRVPGLVLAGRLAILWVRYGVGLYHRARGRIVLFDRYALDGNVPSGADPGPLARLSRRVQAAACPTPDLVLLLDASGATMHRRKGEYDPARLETWRAAYARLQGRVRGLEVLDAERPADDVCREAVALVWRCYAERRRPRAAGGR